MSHPVLFSGFSSPNPVLLFAGSPILLTILDLRYRIRLEPQLAADRSLGHCSASNTFGEVHTIVLHSHSEHRTAGTLSKELGWRPSRSLLPTIFIYFPSLPASQLSVSPCLWSAGLEAASRWPLCFPPHPPPPTARLGFLCAVLWDVAMHLSSLWLWFASGATSARSPKDSLDLLTKQLLSITLTAEPAHLQSPAVSLGEAHASGSPPTWKASSIYGSGQEQTPPIKILVGDLSS